MGSIPDFPSHGARKPAAFDRAAALVLDLAISSLVGVWIAGGVSWNGKLLLRHGADPRRAALLLALAGAWLLPRTRNLSLWLRASSLVWSWLLTRRGRWIALGLGFVVSASIAALQALALRVPLYDVGLFHQILWSVAHGHGFVSTISGAGDFLLDHLSPSLALLAPAFWLSASSSLTLPVAQAALLTGGVAAWVWLAERLEAGPARASGLAPQPWLAAAVTLFGLFFDSLWGNLHWGFHENAIAFASLSWAYALILAGWARDGWGRAGALLLFLVAAGSKEILLVDVAFALGAWGFWRAGEVPAARSRRFGIWLGLLAAGLLAAFVWFERIPHPADKNYFDRYYAYLGHGLGEFARGLLLTPWKVVSAVGAGELARYFLTVFGPWLFLPLAALARGRRVSVWLLALLPSLASSAIATYPPLRRASFHYVLELWPVLAAVTVYALSRLGARKVAVAWALLSLLAWDHDPVGALREYVAGAREQRAARRALEAIPAQASVSADELAGPWVAGRLRVTRWGDLAAFGGKCPDVVVLRGEGEASRVFNIACGGIRREARRVGDWLFFAEGP